MVDSPAVCTQSGGISVATPHLYTCAPLLTGQLSLSICLLNDKNLEQKGRSSWMLLDIDEVVVAKLTITSPELYIYTQGDMI